MKSRSDIIIIGSGLGGLACGAYLARKGYKVKLFERLSHPGGIVYTFKRKDYWFEASTHQFTGFKNPLGSKNILKKLGLSDLPYIELPECYEAILFDKEGIKKNFLIRSGYRKALHSYIRYFPGQKRMIKRLFRIFNKISHNSLRIARLGWGNPLFHLYDALTALCLLKGRDNSLIQKIGIASYPWLVKYYNHTFHDIIKDITDPELTYLLSQYSFFVGTPPERISGLVMCLMINVLMLNKPFFIKGGGIWIVRRLCEEIKKHNGIIHYQHDVAEILIRDKKAMGIRLKDGTEHFGVYIVSNANAYSTYHTLIKDRTVLPAKLECKIKDYTPGLSVFQTYLGLPFDLRDYGYKTASYLFSPSLDIGFALSHSELYPFILTNYSLMDPHYAMPGKSSVVLTRFCDHKPWIISDRKTYLVKKKKAQEAFISLVKDLTHIPLEKAEVLFSASPRTFIHYSGNPFGSAIGAEHTLSQSGIERFQQKSPVPNLLLAGHDTQPGGGIGSALASGIVVGNYIDKET